MPRGSGYNKRLAARAVEIKKKEKRNQILEFVFVRILLRAVWGKISRVESRIEEEKFYFEYILNDIISTKIFLEREILTYMKMVSVRKKYDFRFSTNQMSINNLSFSSGVEI